MTDTNLTDGDYVLVDGAAWFTVKNIAVRIHCTDEGVVVDMYPNGHEMHASIASAYAYYDEANPTE